ncbi:MAG TPA: cation:proton antiporter [Bacillota bacterium]|nr:cation:proton antiporter [Bacillota bacterium]
MHGDAFLQLSVVLVLAAVISLVMRALRQPLIIGYILTGILVGPSALNVVQDHGAFDAFSDLGIALLLFIIGLGLNAAVFRRLGRVVFITALSLLLVVGTVGFGTAQLFHFTTAEAVIIGLGLFFSSTIVIAKMLSDKKEIGRIHGQITIGVILLDDIVATLALLFVVADSGGSLSAAQVGMLALKGVGLLAVFSIISWRILPKLSKYMASSQELLFLFALAWGFGIAVLVHKVGFSIEIGALAAGVMLAPLPYCAEIASRLRPLRDFFIVLFFVVLGEGLTLGGVGSALWPAIALSLIVILIKPIVAMSALGLLGYTKRTSFKSAVNLSQISEFSIILTVLAFGAGIVSERVSTIITLVALFTIASSTYLMQYSNRLYTWLEPVLQIFERRQTREHEKRNKSYPLILFGYKKGGHEFVKTFRAMGKPFIVVDYNPDIIELLDRQHIDSLYGDATDPELLSELHIHKAKLVVSTITDMQVNAQLVRYVAHYNKDAVIICHADDHNQAADLYEMGATYVILPHFIGSERMGMFLQRNGLSKQKFAEHREKHIVTLGHIANDAF